MSTRVLIVDDSNFTRTIHKQIVTGEGYETVEAASGKEAVEVFAREKPDLVLIDLLMPDMDGMDAARKLLEIDPAARIVICSTDKQKVRQEEARELGVLEFFTKPLDPEKLAESLDRILND